MKNSVVKTKELVLKSAMACIAERGLEDTTFQAIADKARISQPLVVYHLKSRDRIFLEVFQYILDTSLVQTETALSQHESAVERLKEYVEVSLNYFRSDPAIEKIYIAFYYLSSFHPHYRAMNEKLKSEATQRILNIIAIGMGQGEFHTTNPLLGAKMIHNAVTGLLLNLATETPKFSDEVLKEELKKNCLLIVK